MTIPNWANQRALLTINDAPAKLYNRCLEIVKAIKSDYFQEVTGIWLLPTNTAGETQLFVKSDFSDDWVKYCKFCADIDKIFNCASSDEDQYALIFHDAEIFDDNSANEERVIELLEKSYLIYIKEN